MRFSSLLLIPFHVPPYRLGLSTLPLEAGDLLHEFLISLVDHVVCKVWHLNTPPFGFSPEMRKGPQVFPVSLLKNSFTILFRHGVFFRFHVGSSPYSRGWHLFCFVSMSLPYKKDACGLFRLKKARFYAGLRHFESPETKVLQKRCRSLWLYHSI